jgi:hypothetical protein
MDMDMNGVGVGVELSLMDTARQQLRHPPLRYHKTTA